MKRSVGRPLGTQDRYWPDRLMNLLTAVMSIQDEQHTVSYRELVIACGVSRQTIGNWLGVAEEMGYVDRHGGRPRALQLLPKGRKLVRQYEALDSVKAWRQMREGLEKQNGN